MINKINLSGEGRARGRNGSFTPHTCYVRLLPNGLVEIQVYSKERGARPPIMFQLAVGDALRLSTGIAGLDVSKPSKPKTIKLMDGIEIVIPDFALNAPPMDEVVTVEYEDGTILTKEDSNDDVADDVRTMDDIVGVGDDKRLTMVEGGE